MDYEQRYKEALDEAKAIHKAIRQDLKPVIEQIFPEFKESDDDRIRKAIQFERFVRRKESDFAFKEDENGVIKFVHKKVKYESNRINDRRLY